MMMLYMAAPLVAALVCLVAIQVIGTAALWDGLMVVTFFACKAVWFVFLAVMLEWLARALEARHRIANSGVPPVAPVARVTAHRATRARRPAL